MDSSEDLDTHTISPITTGRLEAFSDGIIAIAATLLILDVHKPEKGEPLGHWFQHNWFEIDAYLIAFITIGIMWVNHHTLFHLVRKVDRPLLFLNLGLLAMIAFLPLPTAIAGQNANSPAAVAFFSGAFAFTGIWFVFIWLYLHQNPHLMEPGARDGTAMALRRTALGPVFYVAATLLALVAPGAAIVANALIALYFVLPLRGLKHSERD